MTDANVLLGRIPLGVISLACSARRATSRSMPRSCAGEFAELAADIVSASSGVEVAPEAVAAGFLTVAVENMANAIRKITIERGEDARDFTLCCFGGAGGQHACQVAGVLGIAHVLAASDGGRPVGLRHGTRESASRAAAVGRAPLNEVEPAGARGTMAE